MSGPSRPTSSLARGQPRIWPLIAAAAALAVAGFVSNLSDAIRIAMVAVGGALVGLFLGWTVSREGIRGPNLWPIVTALGISLTIPGFTTDFSDAARVTLVVAGGALLGLALGWAAVEPAILRFSLAGGDAPWAPVPGVPEGPQPPSAYEEYGPVPSYWPILAALGAAIALPGFIADLPDGLQIALVSIGLAIAALAIVSWFLEEGSLLLPGVLPAYVPRRRARPTPIPGPARPYLPPTRALRTETRQAIHDQAIQDIARLRFAFPTPKYRDYKTYVNHPQPVIGVQMADGSVAYPDIVVVQHPENYTKIVAEVETNETVTADVARYEWLPYADLAPLYLYVPVGKGDEALALCRRFHIPVVGIRTWRYVVGYEEIEINDHYTVPAGPEELLPKLLRRSA